MDKIRTLPIWRRCFEVATRARLLNGKLVGDVLPLLVLVTISLLLPLIWLRSGLAVTYAEPGFIYIADQRRLFDMARFIWSDGFATGTENTRVVTMLSYYALTSGLEAIGFSAVARQYLLFGAVLASASLSMYCVYLCLSDFAEPSRARLAATVAALFYILNPFALNFLWHRFTSSLFGLPLPPLLLLMTIHLWNGAPLRRGLAFPLILTVFSITAINPAYAIPLALPAFVWAIFELLTGNLRVRRLPRVLIGLLPIVLVTILLNSWWILPMMANLTREYRQTLDAIDPYETLFAVSKARALLYTLRLLDSNIRWLGVRYEPGWVEFLIPLVGMMALLRNPGRTRVFLLAGVLLVAGLWLGKGSHPPGENAFLFLFDNAPFFKAFRDPYDKLGINGMFSFALLIGLAMESVPWHRLVGFGRMLTGGGMVVVLILLLGVAVWPMWTGDVFSLYAPSFTGPADEVPETHVEVPYYYYEAAGWLAADPLVYRLFFLPQSPFDFIIYDWPHGYIGGDFGTVDLILNRPAIMQYTGNKDLDVMRATINEELASGGTEKAARLLGLLNARYIMVRKDVNKAIAGLAETIEAWLFQGKGFQPAATFGKLSFFMVEDSYFLPRVYAVQNPLTTDVGFADMDPASRQQIAEQPTQTLNYTILDFRQINPARYEVRVSARTPFWLILASSYNPGWRAYYYRQNAPDLFKGSVLLSGLLSSWSRVEIDQHHLVNGYANGWYVENPGEYTIALEYAPQGLLEAGLAISVSTLLACITYFIVSAVRERRARRHQLSTDPMTPRSGF